MLSSTDIHFSAHQYQKNRGQELVRAVKWITMIAYIPLHTWVHGLLAPWPAH